MREDQVINYAMFVCSWLIGVFLPLIIQKVGVKFVRCLIVVSISVLIFVGARYYERYKGRFSLCPMACFSVCLCMASRKEVCGR